MKGRASDRRGLASRYDPSTPSGVDHERMFLLEQAGGIQFSPRDTRFCETCQRHIKFPPGKRPKAFKGWKCKECRAN